MRSVNKVILIGNVTRDPELRQTPNGQSVVTFGIATNREWVTRGGQKNNLAEFHDVVAWANLAEICSQYLKKGKLVYVEGYLKTRSWDTPEGVKKFKTEIVVQDMIMLDKRTSAPLSGGSATGDADESDDYIPEEESAGNGNNEPAHSAPAQQIAPMAEKRESAPIKTEVKEIETPQAAPAAVGIDDDLGL